MKISRTAQRFGSVFIAIAALITLSGFADAATSKPAAMSKAEYQALALRSEALNEHYRLGRWKGVPAGMSASEYQALMIRSEALNKKYSLGTSGAAARPDDRADRFTPGASPEPAVITSRTDGRTVPDAVDARNAVTPVVIQADNSGTASFDWLAALIGGLTVGGLALATGGLLVLRHHGPTLAR
jgi:hypothetical protein